MPRNATEREVARHGKYPVRTREALRAPHNTELMHYYRARNLAQQRRYEEARRLYARFVREHKARDELKGDALSRLGSCYWLLDNHRMAGQSYLRALACQTEVGDQDGASWTRVRFAELRWKAAEFSQAHALLDESLRIFQELDDVIGIVAARQMLADIYYWECKFAAAEKCQLELIDAMPTLISSSLPMTAAVHRLAEIRRFQGKLPQSLRDYEYCRSKYELLPPAYELGWTLAGIGDIYRIQGDMQEAYKFSSQALRIFDHLRFAVGMGWATRALAEVLRHSGKNHAAAELVDAAKGMFKDANDSRGLASCVASKAEICLAQSDFAAAGAMFQDACDSLKIDRSWYAYARAMRGLAASRFGAGDVSGAASALCVAVQLFEGMGNSYQAKLSGLLGAKICIVQGDQVRARELVEQALQTCEEVGDGVHKAELQSMLGKL
jgi:tetratricopeptide (TPR) repeat protein